MHMYIYRFLGLCNNYAYVIMLSAAHDILLEQQNSTLLTTHSETTDIVSISIKYVGPTNYTFIYSFIYFIYKYDLSIKLI